MQLGKDNTMVCVQKTDFGVYLAETGKSEEKVLLPKKWVPSDLEIGDPVSVFLYKDSEDRPVATTLKPAISLGRIARLKVLAVTKIGAFLDWGLEKDLLLPFREQTRKVAQGEEIPVALYLDKSDRLCATMKLYPYLSTRSPYVMGDEVEGTVYEISENFGAFVAVDDSYSGLIPKRELTGKTPAIGGKIKARISRVHEDGKLDLDLRQKAYLQIGDDADKLMALLESGGGRLALHDKSAPEDIRSQTGMSKNEFKKAVGHLYKERLIRITDSGIEKV